MNPDRIEELIAFHRAAKEEIAGRLADFRRVWAAGSDEDLFAELAFCLLTPQSRARVCWPAVERLRGCGLLYCGSACAFAAREWLVGNVLGLGYKEAGHFLRNIGLAEELAILDRHILKNLVILGVIDEIPKSLTRKRYLEPLVEGDGGDLQMKSWSFALPLPFSASRPADLRARRDIRPPYLLPPAFRGSSWLW